MTIETVQGPESSSGIETGAKVDDLADRRRGGSLLTLALIVPFSLTGYISNVENVICRGIPFWK